MKRIVLLTWILLSSLALFASSDKPEISGEILGDKLVVSFNIPKGMHQVLQKEYFKIEVSPIKGLSLGPVVYPTNVVKGEYGDEYRGLVRLTRKITRTGAVDANSLKVTAYYQLCSDTGSCLMPAKTVINVALPKSLSQAPVVHKELSAISRDNDVLGDAVSTGELIYMLLLALLGGVILNLMPCVLPVLSIKMLSIVNTAHQDRKSILKGGLLYTTGVLSSFLLLALLIIALKKSGEAVGWGFQFQNPYFVFILMLVIWGFALSLFEVFIFRVPFQRITTQTSSAHSSWGTFMSGVFAVLLATPCTAPLLGSAVGFALKQSSIIIVLTMFFIGLGLALPFILLSFIPVTINFIPRPGNWMNIFREVMGFMLLGTAVFLLRTLSFIIAPSEFINVLWFVLIFSFALWFFGLTSKPYFSKKKQWIGTLISAVIVFVAAWSLIDFSEKKTATYKSIGTSGREYWQTFTPERLRHSIQAGKTVFVDFSAEWCMTCKANELMVLNTKEIQTAFHKKGVVLLYGDYTRKNELILKWLQKYGKAGVPLYLLFVPGKKKAIVFPEIITKKMIINELDKLP